MGIEIIILKIIIAIPVAVNIGSAIYEKSNPCVGTGVDLPASVKKTFSQSPGADFIFTVIIKSERPFETAVSTEGKSFLISAEKSNFHFDTFIGKIAHPDGMNRFGG